MADTIIDLYRRHGLSWAKARRKDLFERIWLDRFRALMPDAATVLDLGCGTGDPMARYLMDQDCTVTGVDTAPDMLAQADQRGTWVSADMRWLNLKQTFDGILAWNSFFHLTPDDQRAMFATFARHAAPGSALIFTSGPAAGVAMGELEGDALYHASLDPANYRQLLLKHDFTVIRHIAEDPDCAGHTVWLAQRT